MWAHGSEGACQNGRRPKELVPVSRRKSRMQTKDSWPARNRSKMFKECAGKGRDDFD